MRTNPCRGCEDRSVGCHANCQEYIAWKEELTAFKEKIRSEKDLKWSVDEARERAFKRRPRRKLK